MATTLAAVSKANPDVDYKNVYLDYELNSVPAIADDPVHFSQEVNGRILAWCDTGAGVPIGKVEAMILRLEVLRT